MSANRKADRRPSRFLLALLGRLERYMLRAGLIAFMAEPTDTPPAGGATPPAEGAPPAGTPPAADAKPAEGATPPVDVKPAEGAKPTDDGKPAAPEAYTDFTLPEGMPADAKLLDGFKAVAKELGLPQDGAQKVVSLYAEHQAAQFRQTVETWETQAKTDKEFGGDKFDENIGVAKKALDQFATPEFNAWLKQTGLGSHPEMVRAFYRVGKAISEDGFAPGRAGGVRATPQSMYSASNMNP